MNFHIRKAKKEDAKQILNLIIELAVFENEPNAVEINTEDIISSGFGKFKDFSCFVAETNEIIVGIALVYSRFSTWKGRILHLEDLIVTKKYRGKGIGSALLDKVVTHASDINAKRICWEVLTWNISAIEFYKSKGADVKQDWNVVHLNEDGIRNYMSKLKV